MSSLYFLFPSGCQEAQRQAAIIQQESESEYVLLTPVYVAPSAETS